MTSGWVVALVAGLGLVSSYPVDLAADPYSHNVAFNQSVAAPSNTATQDTAAGSHNLGLELFACSFFRKNR